jgi:glyoxylase I family protein
MSQPSGNAMSAVRANVSRPRRLHHAAWITRDQEATRHFYEDIVGIPLVATWNEKSPANGREYCHTFFAMGDGGALAFFQYADQDENPIELNSPGHVAFECDAETQQGIKERLEIKGICRTSFRINSISRFILCGSFNKG